MVRNNVVIPDDVLLEIFDFCMITAHPLASNGFRGGDEAWKSLVHVCRRWRNLVFGSPRSLNLQPFCTPGTRTKDLLDVWPALPLIIYADDMDFSSFTGMDNIIAALGQSNRARQIFFQRLAGWQLEEVLAGAMRAPFPELTDLLLTSNDDSPPVITDSFLDGSAPRLQYFRLYSIPFPGLPKLLLSATHLVKLSLSRIQSPFRIHLTRSDGRSPLRVVQP